MKRLALITCILLTVTAAEFCALEHTRSFTDSLSDSLSTLSLQADPLPGLEAIQAQWDSGRKYLSLFLHERPLDEFERLLAEAGAHAAAAHPDTGLLLKKAAGAAEDIWQSERPNPQNIL